MKTFEPLRRAWKETLKETLWLLSRHRPGPRKNICLFANRRGGSSWLMDVLSVNRGLKYLDQPFSLHSASSSQLAYLPVVEQSQFIYLDEAQERQVKRYLDLLFIGALQVNAPWEFWRPAFDFVSDRLLLKITDAKGLIDWIDTHYDVHIVYLTRHPIPTALSIIRNRWSPTTSAYLRNETFVARHLNDRQYAFCRDLMKKGTLLQQHVLNWVLENRIPLQLLPQRPRWLHLSYEEMILLPEQVLPTLARDLELTDLDRMKKIVRSPSRSTKKPSSVYTSTTPPLEQLRFWQDRLSREEQRSLFEIMDMLELSLYRPDSPLPTQWGVIDETRLTARYPGITAFLS